MTDAANPTPKKEVKPVGTLEMVSYSMGNAANSLIMLGTGTYLNFFWTDIAMIPLAAMGTILSFARFLGIGTDILMGFLLDRTKNKHGKARPWILWMALPMLISYLALFYVPNMSETGRIVYAFITYNLVAFFTMSALALPMQSLLALITNDPKKRLTMSMLNMSVGTLFQILGNMAVMPAINALGGGQQGYFRFFGILGVIGTALYLLVFFGTTERVTQEESEEKKEEKISVREVIRLYLANKWWIIMTFFQGFSFLYPSFMAINMYYMTWVMGNPALMGPFQSIMSAAMLITLIVGTPIVPRIGKIYASFLAMLLQFVGNFLPLFAPTSVPVIMIASALRGAGPAILLGTNAAFMCDVIEYGEWKTGRRLEGLTFSIAGMGGKIGSALGGLVFAFLLAKGGYVGGATTQTPQAINMIKIIFTWCHSFGSIACTILLFYLRKLDEQMPQIMADLAARKKSLAT